MAQIVAPAVGAVSANVSTVTHAAAPSPAQAAFNRSVASAAKAVNSAGIVGENREVTFSIDPATKTPVVRVVDVNTKEVVDQWPPEYLLELAQSANEARNSG